MNFAPFLLDDLAEELLDGPVSVSDNAPQGGGPRNAVLAYIKVDGSGAVTSGKLSTTL